MTLVVQLMGTVRFLRDGQPVDVGGPKPQAVLAVLALSAGRRVSTDRLVDVVWDENPPASARRSVQSYVASLRRAVGAAAVLESSRNGYTLNVARGQVDLLVFEDEAADLLADAALDADDKAQGLADVLSTWESPLDGLRGTSRLEELTAPFEELRLQAVEGLVAAQIAGTRAGDAVKMLEGLVREYPTRENLWLELAHGLNCLGRRDAALNAIQRAREALREQLGVDPSARLSAVETNLLVGRAAPGHGGDGVEPGSGHGPVLSEPERRPSGLDGPECIYQVGTNSLTQLPVHRDVVGNLPVEMDAFVGRATEVMEVAEAVGAHRVVTLIGVGGAGKTRLALRVAGSVLWQFPDGCWLVDLAAVASDGAAPFAVARGLGVEAPEVGDVMQHVTARVGRQRRLVVVDNCEHLLDASGDVIEQLVGSCPNAHVLATSREPVMVRGERLFAVPSLSSDDAYGLFLERAAAEAPGLELDTIQTAAAVQLCERLDRLPLAIELVASRLRTQTPVELLAAIDERLRLLVGGRRSRMERHQTMRNALDWSYDLCEPIEQQVFDRLSVFAAGFDLYAAVAVSSPGSASEGEVADAVLRLVDRSLVSRTQAVDGRSRFRLLEIMRTYGREHLQAAGTSDDVRRRHADWVAAECETLPEAWHGPDPTAAEAGTRTLLPDIVTALDWRLDRREWTEAPVLFFACYYAEPGFYTELVDRVWIAAEAVGETDRLPAVAIAQNSPRLEGGEISHDDIKQRTLSEIRNGSWRTHTHLTEPPPHIALVELSLTPDEATEVHDSLRDLGAWPVHQQFIAHHCAAVPLARSLGAIDDVLDEVHRLADVLGGPHAIGQARGTRGWIASLLGDWERSIQHHEEALDLLPVGYANTIGIRSDILLCRVLANREVRSEHVRTPWQQVRDLDVEHPAGFLAYCTGVALVHLGHADIARPFFCWYQARRRREEHPMHHAVRERVPESASLIEAAEPEVVPIDRITDTALAAADILDAANTPATT